MAHKIEKLKEKIKSGTVVTGVSVSSKTDFSYLEDLQKSNKYDFVAVDNQHSPLSEELLANFSSMANSIGMPVMLRIKHRNDGFLIGHYLDLGPSLIEIPQVESVNDVIEARDNFYYPQIGIRSWGGSFRPCIGDYPDRIEYSNWWNKHGILCTQLESINAVSNARNYGLNGADIVSWGPNDLAFNLEGNPFSPLKTDDDCVSYVLDQLSGMDTKLCMRTYAEEDVSKYLKAGVTVFLDESKLYREPS